MSLSVRTSAMAGAPLGGGEDWGDSPYGSLISAGPRKFRKKPVLVLADEELAEARLAMAMGGAEIMEMQPDPVAAPRPRQPAVMLGLVPMGVDDSAESRASYIPAAPVLADEQDEADGIAWQPLPEFDEPEPEEAEVQVWVPEPEAEEPAAWDQPTAPEEPASLPHAASEGPGLTPEPAVPSIEDQLERMRERLARRAAATAAAAPVAASPAARPSTIERLELDDWSVADSLKGLIPPQEQDLQPRAAPAPAPAPAHASPVPRQPEPAPEPRPASAPPPAVARDPVTSEPVRPEPAPVVAAAPLAVEEPFEPDLAAILPDDDQAALDAWGAHVAPVAPPPRRHAGIRAQLSEDWESPVEEPAPSLLARLWGWLRGRL